MYVKFSSSCPSSTCLIKETNNSPMLPSSAKNIRSVIRIRPSKAKSTHLTAFQQEREIIVHPTVASAAATMDLYREVGTLTASLPSSSSSAIKRFTFDEVFPSNVSQEEIFESVGAPVVENVIKGYNATVLSYGQTGSGKTYTMLGPAGGQSAMIRKTAFDAETGLLPRILRGVFDALTAKCAPSEEGSSAETEFSVSIGVVELYNEVLADLTATFSNPSSPSPASPAAELKIREDRSPGGRGIFIDGLAYHKVETVAHALEIIAHANDRKSMGVTKMNETSSRSHTVVNVQIAIIDLVGGSKTSAEMFLVDLAGSERVGKTGATGDRLREAQGINLSLTLLGNVISKLADDSLHIPYRDAKLTRLLQDSLGGNALTTLICTCAPEPDHLQETISSIQFAQRAKQIKNKPIQNVSLSASELQEALRVAQTEIAALHERVRVLSCINRGDSGNEHDVCQSDSNSTLTSLLRENQELKEELREARNGESALKKVVAFHSKQEQTAKEEARALEAKLQNESASLRRALHELERLASKSTTTLSSSSKQIPKSETKSKTPLRRPSSENTKNRSLAPRPPVATTSPSEEVDGDVLKILQLHDTVNRLQKQLDEQGKFVVLVDSQKHELDALKQMHEARVEAITVNYENQLSSLSEKLELLAVKTAEHGSSPEDIELANSQKLVEINNRLQQENEELHSENRVNGMRMYELARQVDAATTEIRELKDKREQMIRDIEFHALADGELRRKLLAALSHGQKEDNGRNREYFRKRFFECLDVTSK